MVTKTKRKNIKFYHPMELQSSLINLVIPQEKKQLKLLRNGKKDTNIKDIIVVVDMVVSSWKICKTIVH